MSIAHSITTAQQLLEHSSELGRCELVRGELVQMSPSSFRHGMISARLARLILEHVDDLHLGAVTGAESGFLIARNPDTVRAPDVGFVRKDRLHLQADRGYFPETPDLAVEVLSPDDSASAVLSKTAQWLDAGCIAVWLVDPEQLTISVHRSDHPVVTFSAGETLTGQPPLETLQLPVDAVFE